MNIHAHYNLGVRGECRYRTKARIKNTTSLETLIVRKMGATSRSRKHTDYKKFLPADFRK